MKIGKRGCLMAMALAVGLAVYALIQVQCNLDLGFSGPCLLVSTDAATGNQAHLLEQGFQDRELFLFIRPSSDSQAMPELIAMVTEQTPHSFDSAVWSRDGSVIACRSQMTEREVQEKRRNGGRESFLYSYAYDFQESKPLLLGPDSRQDRPTHSKTIKDLLDSRGGPGKIITLDDIRRSEQQLDWTKWQVYQRAIREKHRSRTAANPKALPSRP